MKTLEEIVDTDLKLNSSRRPSQRATPVNPTELKPPLKLRGSRRNKNWSETYSNDLQETKLNLTINLGGMERIKDEVKLMLDNPNRTDEEALAIYHLLWDTKFFTDIAGDNGDVINLPGMVHICKKLRYLSVASGTVLINQEDSFTSKAYVILSGQVSIMNKTSSGQLAIGNSSHRLTRPSIFINESPSNRSSTRVQKFLGSPVALGRRRLSAFSPLTHVGLFEATVEKLKSRKSFRKQLDISSEDVSRDSNGDLESSIDEADESKIKKMFNSNTRLSVSEPVEKLVERLRDGDFFGAKCSFRRLHRSLAAVANCNVELLVLDKEDLEFAKNEFIKTKTDMVKFLAETFPHFKSEEEENVNYEEILHTADIKLLNYQRKVMNEGDIGGEFYAILEGECELIKTIIYDKSEHMNFTCDVKSLYGLNKNAKEEFKVSSFKQGSLFGEEILFSDKCPYEYSVKVISEKAKLLAFRKSEFLQRCNNEKLEQLKLLFEDKNNRNTKYINEKLSKKGMHIDPEALKSPKPTVRIPKSKLMYDQGSYQSLSPTKVAGKLSNEDFDYVMQASIAALEVDTPIEEPKEKPDYYMPLTKQGQNVNRTLKTPFHSFISRKFTHSLANTPTQSKEHSMERKSKPNTSFQNSKDVSTTMPGQRVEKITGFKLAKASNQITEIFENKFDFGRSKKPKFLKLKAEPHEIQTGSARSSPKYQHRNIELGDLITLKMKEMEQVNESYRTPKPHKEVSLSEKSAGIFKGPNFRNLKIMDATSKLMGFEDYKLECMSPLNGMNSPKESSRSNKNQTKSRVRMNKIVSYNPSPNRTPDLLPNIQVNRCSPGNNLKSGSEKTAKLFF